LRRKLIIAGLISAIILGVSACGHAVLSSGLGVAHRHVTHSHGIVRHTATHAAWCAYHLYRLQRDVSHHKLAWSAFQAWRSAHHCTRVI